ncbi:hypothetical protein [Methylobacterium nonmethylotrophicum]|nr:hypothetical protein [Methylobacterium nonmethylotrophicum]
MSSNASEHRVGHDVDAADQVSSLVLLGFAAVGAALTVALNAVLI